eukprot:TRINITY_DN1551_c0_g2_i1.p1 TRINITY_DN1551_c0_g2~~TRINITY_DN1551_c0_g2_i1.p1  ORF type:complete len:427 (-),score=107.22 TRINITY_DN1551_c0_g2_i1:1132-2412(-)
MGRYQGDSTCVLFPTTVDQVQQLLKYCNDKRIAVCPQGGNTGLVGGSVPVYDEIIISMEKMNSIRKFDEASGVVISDAGVVLQDLDQYLSDYGYTVPIDLGAKGSCQIGGNVATNAGGLRLLRYGSLHGTVLGLEVVLPDGRVINGLKTLRKDNTGYDLKQLFIGSEGSLGIITGVSLLCPPVPKSIKVALFGLSSFKDAVLIQQKAKLQLQEILSACEFFDNSSMKLVCEHFNVKEPIEDSSIYVLIETRGSNDDHDTSKLNSFLENMYEECDIIDGTVAESGSQMKAIWFLRESIASAISESGATYKYDFSLPTPEMYSIVDAVRKELSNYPDPNVYGYGHIGDGNIHLNIMAKEYSEDLQNKLEPFVYEYTSNFNGSISAEHGIGQMKADHIHYSKSEIELEIMKNIKQIFDRNGIMNPYKVI